MINKEAGGLSKSNRILLDKINREIKSPVNTSDIASILNLPEIRTRSLVTYWIKQGWLTRIKRGLYMTVPLGSVKPEDRREDQWLIAAKVFEPCYVGGWSACEYWALTDQIFKDMIVFTSRRFNRSKKIIQDTTYIVKTINKQLFYGLKPAWRGQNKINVSDPSRTIVDILNNPYLGGGIRNVAEIIKIYFTSEHRNEKVLLDYIASFGNRSIYKRLGYIIENAAIEAGQTADICRKNISSGYTRLDPSLSKKGNISRRWNLIINALIK